MPPPAASRISSSQGAASPAKRAVAERSTKLPVSRPCARSSSCSSRATAAPSAASAPTMARRPARSRRPLPSSAPPEGGKAEERRAQSPSSSSRAGASSAGSKRMRRSTSARSPSSEARLCRMPKSSASSVLGSAALDWAGSGAAPPIAASPARRDARRFMAASTTPTAREALRLGMSARCSRAMCSASASRTPSARRRP
mmetsp:Transcript_8863/g.26368  ORF Transcript_8863/g.26368 Transcript_8863/m.26368 type:complete len:200 (+) Transcript_8863:750-1349(+)